MRGRAPRVERLTPPGSGGVAVVAVSGPGALVLVAALLDIELPAPGGVRLGRLVRRAGSEAETVDEVLVAVHGEERVELGVHGSPVLVDEVLELLGAERGRAGRGERGPTSVESRACSRLVDAPGELGARILLDQAEGALRAELEELRSRRCDSRGDPRGDSECEEAHGQVRDLVARWPLARPLLVATKVVLAGPTNAGKSTLFNALVGERRAITSAEPGTTRDAVSARAEIDSLPVELFDTAGERETGGARGAQVEAAGQALARQLAASVDLVLWLVPFDAEDGGAGGESEPEQDVPRIVVRTCADRVDSDPSAWPEDALSALTHPADARRRIGRLLRRAVGLPEDLSAALWEPGSAVPFEAELARAVEAAFALPPGAGRDARLDALLGPA